MGVLITIGVLLFLIPLLDRARKLCVCICIYMCMYLCVIYIYILYIMYIMYMFLYLSLFKKNHEFILIMVHSSLFFFHIYNSNLQWRILAQNRYIFKRQREMKFFDLEEYEASRWRKVWIFIVSTKGKIAFNLLQFIQKYKCWGGQSCRVCMGLGIIYSCICFPVPSKRNYYFCLHCG